MDQDKKQIVDIATNKVLLGIPLTKTETHTLLGISDRRFEQLNKLIRFKRYYLAGGTKKAYYQLYEVIEAINRHTDPDRMEKYGLEQFNKSLEK